MNSSITAQPRMADNAVAAEMSATSHPTNVHDARQSVRDFRAELLMIIPQLRAFARMLSSDKSSAEEISLKTVAEAWRCRFGVGPETELKAWLFTIARNTYYSNRHHDSREAPFEHTPRKSVAGHGLDQTRSADTSDAMRALRFLPHQYREALILVSASGCSYEEAAQICDCTVGTVKSRVLRAQQALAANFDTMSVV